MDLGRELGESAYADAPAGLRSVFRSRAAAKDKSLQSGHRQDYEAGQ